MTRSPEPPDFEELWKSSTNRPPASVRPSLVPVTEGRGNPFFFVHWASGNIDFLTDIAGSLPGERPIYGIASPGFRHRQRPFQSVYETADYYLAQIRDRQPGGPYFLAGICSGASIAYEIARRITADGNDVAALVLVNSLQPGTRQLDPAWDLADVYAYRLSRLRTLAGTADLGTCLPALMTSLKNLGWIDRAAPAADFYWHQVIWAANTYAQDHYQPPPYTGPAYLVQDTDVVGLDGADWSSLIPHVKTFAYEATSSIELMARPEFAEIYHAVSATDHRRRRR